LLDDAEYDESEEYADQTIANDGGAESRAEALEDRFVKGEADLLAAV